MRGNGLRREILALFLIVGASVVLTIAQMPEWKRRLMWERLRPPRVSHLDVMQEKAVADFRRAIANWEREQKCL